MKRCSKFSLIMATLGRDKDVFTFCSHLANQTYFNFELIIVDQNDDRRLDSVVAAFQDKFKIFHIRSPRKGLSHNRNIGMMYASGDILAFPDDDCYYNDDTLEYVLNGFEQTGADYFCINYNDEKYPEESKWGETEKIWIRKKKFYEYGISISLFIKREIEQNFRFDEQLGVGSSFGSGEETDLLLYFLSKKYSCYYDGTYCIHHPYTKMYTADLKRVYSYSLGFGAIHKKAFIYYRNFYALPRFIKFLCANAIKVLFLQERKRSWTALKGKLWGFITYKITEENK
ncbi:MAG: glycosyltransferase family 2 protein [Treponema sp.]|nr:glycosyltransferase family 2 protein [Treponema sp.]